MLLNVFDMGLVDYKNALFFQKKILTLVKDEGFSDSLIFCEHNDVFTIGRSGSIKNVLCDINALRQAGIEVVFADRGGDVTYHGKGQLVLYPILNLRNSVKDVHLFLRRLEQVAINTLLYYGIEARLIKGKTGVWVGNDKIASIGIALSKWVTYHGLSINFNTDLNFFSLINPCGFKTIKTISVSEILGTPIDMAKAKENVIRNLLNVFGYEKTLTRSAEFSCTAAG